MEKWQIGGNFFIQLVMVALLLKDWIWGIYIPVPGHISHTLLPTDSL
jgi:hypothetical protein